MLQVPAERSRPRGALTTEAGLTSANGGKATQPTLDVVLGGPSGAPAAAPAAEQPLTPQARSEVTVREAPEAISGAGRTATRGRDGAPKPGAEPVLINRELSWLDFNGRVLAQVEDESLPLLERARFLAIASRALDEFFQVRVGGLKQLAAGLEGAASDPHGPQAQVRAIRNKVVDLYARQARAFLGSLVPQLDRQGIRFSDWSSLDEEDRTHLDRVFEERIFPVLTPLAVDPAHPFPYISSLSLNLMVVVTDPASHDQRIARIKVPPLLSRFVVLPDGERFVPLEQVIAAHLHPLFEGMQVVAHHVFRLTRNADYQLEGDEAEDLLEAVRAVLKERRRSPLVVRLEVGADMPAEMVDLLARELEIDAEDVYSVAAPLDLGGLFDVCRLDRPDLKFRPWTPITPPRIAHDLAGSEGDLFRDLREDQVLVHHPYDSFEHTVEAFIELAAEDPQVLAIKQTLYRTSGPVSPIIRSLTRAAEAGKQVVALVELTARFDEQNNINWAEVLEDAGVHVVYGAVGLKTHAKVTLVVREEPGGIRRYCHVGTGNYNRDTARVYEDLGLLSADAALGADVGELFNSLTGYSHQAKYRKLLVAPGTMRPALVQADPPRGRARRGGPDRHQGQQPGRPRDDRGALRRLPGGGRDRPHRAQHLLPAAGRARGQRAHPGPLPGRPLPGALADPPLRPRPPRRRLLHQLRGPDAAQPGPPRRGGGSDPLTRPARPPRPDPGDQPQGRHAGLGPRLRRRVAAGGGRRSHRHPGQAPGGGAAPGRGEELSPAPPVERCQVDLPVGTAFRLRQLRWGRTAATRIERFETIHWDTPDFRLAAWDAGLRYRRGRGWRVTLAGWPEAGCFRSIFVDLDGGPAAPPPEALRLLSGYLGDAEPEPAARLRHLESRRTVDELRCVHQVVSLLVDRRAVAHARRVSLRGGEGLTGARRALAALRRVGVVETTSQPLLSRAGRVRRRRRSGASSSSTRPAASPPRWPRRCATTPPGWSATRPCSWRAATRRGSTRPGWPAGGSARPCRPSARCSTPPGRRRCAPSSAASPPTSARCVTPRSC